VGYLTSETYTSHEDTSTLNGNYGGGNNGVVVEDITVDSNGHVTAVGTRDLDGRFMRQGLTLSNPNTIENGGNRYDPSTNSPTNEHYAIITYGNGGNVTGQLATHFQTGKLYSRGHNNSWSGWRAYWSDSDFTSTNVSNWNTAYGWGDHSTEGYVKNDEYTTGATFNGSNGIITFTRNDGDQYTVDISSTLTDINVTGGTYNDANQTLTLNKSNGSSVDVTGFAVDTVLHTTGATFDTSDGLVTFTKNNNTTFSVDLDGRYSLSSHNHDSTYLKLAGGTLTGGLNGTTGTFSGKGTFDNLELTSGNRHLTITESGDDWSIMNTQQNNGIILYNGSGGVEIQYSGTTIAEFENGVIKFHEQLDMGTNIITDTKVGQWDTAYGWGDHSQEGYLTSYTETDTLSTVTARGRRTHSNGSDVWDVTTPGLGEGSIHVMSVSTDHAGGAITFNASDANNAQAGIYVKSDGSYGTKMYIATTDSYATGSKTAISIDHNGLVNITRGNNRLQVNGNRVHHAGDFTTTDVANGVTAYGWGDHSTEGYLTSSSTQSKYLRSDTDDTTTGALTIGDGGNQARLILKKADNNTADHIEFYNGTTRVGEIGASDNTWLRLNNVTNKNIYTPRYIRADAGFFVDGTSKGINGSGNFIGGTITGASDANVGNWNTAYGWGDHSQEGYIKSFDNDIDYINSASFDTGTGVITGTGVGNAGFTVDIDGRYLKISDKAADSDKLDGINSSEFLRSNTNDSFTGTITMGTQKALVADNYGRGVYGLYSSTKYQHVWSMGTAYNLSDDGTTSGNLYGLAFTHTNIGGQSKSGLSHQLLIMDNGVTKSAIGRGIWTDGTITTTSHGNSSQWNTAYGWGNHASAGYASSSHTHSTSDITSGTFAAARFATSTRYNIGLISGYSSQSRDKLRVWDSGTYSIGMKSGYDYGHIGSGEYAMSFQMSDTDGRGWWWGDTSHSDDQGAASLTTEGKMVIAKSLSIGQGEDVTTPSDTPLYVEGTTAGETVFEVQGTSGQLFSITDSLIGDIFEVSDISGIPILTVNSSGVVTVDDTLHVTGDVIAYYASDKRLKDNIKPIENAIDKIKMIGGYEFDWNSNSKNNNGHDVGVIAQEIEEVLPELVGTRSDGYKGVKYEKLTALLIQSNKELIARVEELESKLKK